MHHAWHMPYGYTPAAVSRLAFALATMPGPATPKTSRGAWSYEAARAARAATANAVASLASKFSRDRLTRDRAAIEDLALLAWSFAELPRVLEDEHVGHFRAPCRDALKALSKPIIARAEAFNAGEAYATIASYERCYDDISDLKHFPTRDDETETHTSAFAGRTKDDDDGAARRCAVSISERVVADERKVARDVVAALAPVALAKSDDLDTDKLSAIADACARFKARLPGENETWTLVVVLEKRERDDAKKKSESESDAAASKAKVDADADAEASWQQYL